MADDNSKTTYSALVIGASGGIGASLAAALDADPACRSVVRLSRSGNGLDLSSEQSVAAAAERLTADGESFEFIINTSGVLEIDGTPPEKAFRNIKADAMQRAFAVNSIGAALALKYFMPLMARQRRSVFATLSARVGSIGDNRLGGWVSYRASKAALNQIVRCAAIEYQRINPESVIAAIHPGTIKTPLTEKYASGRYTASPAEAAANLLSVLGGLSPEQTGGFFDYAGEAIEW